MINQSNNLNPKRIVHTSVMTKEVIECLRPQDDEVYLDGTIGGGGHTMAILAKAPNSKIIGIDRDINACKTAKKLLKNYRSKVTIVNGLFSYLTNFPDFDGAILDLGASAMQLQDGSRGFSFMRSGPIDMRMSNRGLTAAQILNDISQSNLAFALKHLSGERHALKIARCIKERHNYKKFTTTTELADYIEHTIGRHEKIHPATRLFQTLRILTNNEFEELCLGLNTIWNHLKNNGRLVVISFHRTEDLIVKNFIKDKILLKQVKAKGILRPTLAELKANFQCRSATLRWVIKQD